MLPSFSELANIRDAPLDVLALAVAAEFHDVDGSAALARLDLLGTELSRSAAATDGSPSVQTRVCAHLLGSVHGFLGDSEHYDHPDNSMIDVVLRRGRGMPILLSCVYTEVARRAGMPLAGIGLPGHFVVGHFGADPPILLDPFAGGATIETAGAEPLLRPWSASEIVMRMLSNLVASYQRRGELTAAIRAASMRLALPCEDGLREALRAQLRAMQARLN